MSTINIGTSSTTAFKVESDTTGALLIKTGATPTLAMTLDATGRLLMNGGAAAGLTGAGTIQSYVTGTSLFSIQATNTNATEPLGIRVSYTGGAPNDTNHPFLSCEDTGGARAVFRGNGGLANYSANNVNLSDRREKTNFSPAKDYLNVLCQIPVQTFNYIDQNLEEDPGLTLGVVAQDVQEVAPELVAESNWGTEENPKLRLSIYQTDLQYAMLKAIQELAAEVAALKGAK